MHWMFLCDSIPMWFGMWDSSILKEINDWAGIIEDFIIGISYTESLTEDFYLKFLENAIDSKIIEIVINSADVPENEVFSEEKSSFNKMASLHDIKREVKIISACIIQINGLASEDHFVKGRLVLRICF